jgi:glycosyltransferase involved in cell wall biosynthesis
VGSRLHLLEVDGGLRGRPLNVGSNNALGRYIAFLDDDDQITSGWVEAFRRGAEAVPGRVVRTRGWARNIDRDDAPEGVGFRLSGWPHLRYNRPFDFIEHLMNNSTPICNFAVPTDAVRALGLTFDESLPVHEDWDFFLRAANLLGVLDDDEATSIYHHWGEGDSSRLLGPEEWNRTKKYVSDLWAQRPVLLAPHDVARLNEYLSTMRALERKVETAETRVKRAEERVGASDKAARKANLELNRILNSRSWKVGAPLRGLRRLRDLGRGFVSGQRGKRVRRSRT